MGYIVDQDIAATWRGPMLSSAIRKLLTETDWGDLDFLVIHRFGKLEVNEKIVLVSTFSIHRQESDEACNYIMNFLKKDAPFWKKEIYKKNYKWLRNIK